MFEPVADDNPFGLDTVGICQVKTRVIYLNEVYMEKILIIEDEADIAESLAYNLRRNSFRVTAAESGETGLRLALDKNQSFELILLDVMLPGMNGLEICRRLRREPLTKNTPIVMLSAKASKTDEIVGLETGANAYIKKPFSMRELIVCLESLLRVEPANELAFTASTSA